MLYAGEVTESMIIAEDPWQFIPEGRRLSHLLVAGSEPTKRKTKVDAARALDDDSLAQDIGAVTIRDKRVEIVRIRKSANNNTEELYAFDRYCFVSRLPSGNLIRKYSTDFEIKEAFWYEFKSSTPAGCPEACTPGPDLKTLCLIGKETIDFHSEYDHDRLTSSLPFEVSTVAPTRFGLLLERKLSHYELESPKRNEEPLIPILYTLSHPLNEILPVIVRCADSPMSTKYSCDVGMRTVFSSSELSVVLFYNPSHGYHSLWIARKATTDEALSAAQRLEQSMCSLASMNGLELSAKSLGVQTPASVLRSLISHSRTTTETPSGVSSFKQSSQGQSTSSALGGAKLLFGPSSTSQSTSSPLVTSSSALGVTPSFTSRVTTRSVTAALQSPAARNLASPVVSRLMGLSRVQHTPVPGPNQLISMMPSPLTVKDSPVHQRNIRANHTPGNHSLALTDSSHYWPAEPLMPDICLEMVWSETSRRNEHGLSGQMASKTFVTNDFLGQTWLCYLIEATQQLRCVKITMREGDEKTSIGLMTLIECKDAIALDNKMLLVDKSSNLILYSGITKIGPVHLNTSVLTSPASCRFASAVSSEDGNVSRPPIMSSSRALSDMGDDMALNEVSISPVTEPSLDWTPEAFSGMITGLGPCCGRLFTVEMLSGLWCSSKLPEITKSSVVNRCLKTLSTLITREKALNMYAQWFLKTSQLSSSSVGYETKTELLLFLKFIMEQIGFPCSKVPIFSKLDNNSDFKTPLSHKRPRKSSEFSSDTDWTSLLSSDFHKEHMEGIDNLLGNSAERGEMDKGIETEELDTVAPLFTCCISVFQGLHFCYEECKMNTSYYDLLPYMASSLHAIAKSFGWNAYCDLYQRDFSELSHNQIPSFSMDKDYTDRLQIPRNFFIDRPFSVFGTCAQFLLATKETLNQSARHLAFQATPPRGNWRLVYTSLCFGLLSGKMSNVTEVDRYFGKNWYEKIGLDPEIGMEIQKEVFVRDLTPIQRIRKFVKLTKLLVDDLKSYPTGVALCILDVIYRNRTQPNPLSLPQMDNSKIKNIDSASNSKTDDGMGCLDSSEILALLKLRFPDDLRVSDVRSMLDSSKPIRIPHKQQPGQTEQELKEQQEKYLYGVCLRTCALTFGRAMITLQTVCPLVSQSVNIPELCTHGKIPPRGMKLELNLNHVDLPSRAFDWAQFHNGVAAGLQVTTDQSSATSTLDSAWIVYNMPSSTNQLAPKDAGFLFGLGLNGHLAQLNLFNVHEYLVRGDQLSSIALLLGIAAAKRTTADLQVMKMLATHLPFLLPPTLFELQIDSLIQTAAVVGVGLLYAGNGHPSLAEALLKEMVKPPLAENDPWPEREAYALACGMALGLVTLGQGNQLNNNFGNSTESTLVDFLSLYMNGGLKPGWATESVTSSLTNDQIQPIKAPSNLVKEGPHVNVHVTAPGATIALGLMFLKTENESVAKLLELPATLSLLDDVRPDFLMLRVLSRSLILWEDIVPNQTWIESQVPSVISKFVDKIANIPDYMDEEETMEERWWRDLVDEESVCQAYCNIVSGACLAMAIKFAGSANGQAFNVLLKYCRFFLPEEEKSESNKRILEGAGRATIHCGLNTLLFCLGIVMAGTGNLDVIRIVRMLRLKGVSEPAIGNTHLHGTYLAAHMTLGLLFLGGGRMSLATNNLAVAALVCAFYPKFPVNMADNKSYLQSCRHLWVLACEPRILIPKEKDSDKLAVAHVDLIFRDTLHYKNCQLSLKAPCLLPELSLLKEVSLVDKRYWPIKFKRHTPSWKTLNDLLYCKFGILDVSRRAGYLPYHEDPLGYKSSSALALMRKDAWQAIINEQSNETNEEIVDRYFDSLTHWCTKQECLEIFPFLADLWQIINGSLPLTGVQVCGVKLLFTHVKQQASHLDCSGIINDEILRRLETELERKLINQVDTRCLQQYCGRHFTESSAPNTKLRTLGQFLTYFEVIAKSEWETLNIREYRNLRSFLEKLQHSGMSLKTLIILHQLLSK